MSKENLNSFSWKMKLEDEAALSGELLQDKNHTWEKLHNRLRQKPQRRRVVWYWAAACLLLIISVPFIIFNKKASPKFIHTTAGTPNREAVTGDITTLLNKDSIRYPLLTTNNKIIKQPHIQINPKRLQVYIPIKKETTLIVDVMNQKIKENDPLLSSSNIINSSPEVFTTAPEKKKLKVFHINELGDPVIESPSFARNSGNHSFQFKLLNQDGFTSSSLPANNKVLKKLTTINLPIN